MLGHYPQAVKTAAECLEALVSAGDVVFDDGDYVVQPHISTALLLAKPEFVPYLPWLQERLLEQLAAAAHSLEQVVPDVFKLVLEEQPSRYHSETANASNPGLFRQSWLNTLSDINNDSKHVRLTPQDMKSATALRRGTFSADRTVVRIDYVAPFVYAWSFAVHMPESMADHERLADHRQR